MILLKSGSKEDVEYLHSIDKESAVLAVKNFKQQLQNKKSFDAKTHFLRSICDLIQYQLDTCDHSKTTLTELARDVNFPRLLDGQQLPYTLQPSLFPMFYPTVYFTTDGEPCKFLLAYIALENLPANSNVLCRSSSIASA